MCLYAQVKPLGDPVTTATIKHVLPLCAITFEVACLYVGLAGTIHIYGVHTAFLAGKSPNIRSNAAYIYTVLANPAYMMCVCTHRSSPWATQ